MNLVQTRFVCSLNAAYFGVDLYDQVSDTKILPLLVLLPSKEMNCCIPPLPPASLCEPPGGAVGQWELNQAVTQ